MKILEIDFYKLVVWLLPTILRKPKMLGFMYAIIKPLVILNDKRKTARDENLFNLQHTGQVCHLKHVLNSTFGLTYANGFEIEDVGARGEYLIIYDESDNGTFDSYIIIAEDEVYTENLSQRVYFATIYDENANNFTPLMITDNNEWFYSEAQIAIVYYDWFLQTPIMLISESEIEIDTKTFVVWCPTDIYAKQLARIKSITNQYRLVSRTAKYNSKINL